MVKPGRREQSIPDAWQLAASGRTLAEIEQEIRQTCSDQLWIDFLLAIVIEARKGQGASAGVRERLH